MRMGNEVLVISSTPANGDQDRDFPFRVLRRASFMEQWKALRQCDCVIQMDISLKGLPVCLASGRPFFISHHTALSDGWQNAGPLPKLKRLLSNILPVKNIACSDFIGSQLSNCQTIYSPYDERIFTPYPGPKFPGRLLFVGRLVSNKGADILLESFSALLQQNSAYAGHLNVVGDGPERARLEKEAEGLEINFAGALSPEAVRDEMRRAETLVVPSRIEPYGTVVTEGLASGCKLICSDAGGLPEAGGGFARYFPAGHAEKLGDLLQEAPGWPPDDREKLDAFLQSRSADSTAKDLLELLKKETGTQKK